MIGEGAALRDDATRKNGVTIRVRVMPERVFFHLKEILGKCLDAVTVHTRAPRGDSGFA